MSVGHRLLAVAGALPVTVLAVIADGGSFTHIRDTAAQHRQGGPMSQGVALCVYLTCVMAARERQHDKQAGITARRLSWSAVVLAGGVAQPGGQPRPGAADLGPDRGRRAARRVPGGGLNDRAPCRPPLPPPSPAGPSAQGWPSPLPSDGDEAQDGGDEALLTAARRVAVEHQDQHGQPIARDALRARLGVSNQATSELLRQLRAGEVLPPGVSRAA